MRRRALKGEGTRQILLDAISGLVDDVMGEHIDVAKHPEEWDVTGLRASIKRIFFLEWEEDDDQVRDMAIDEIRGRISDEAVEKYDAKQEEMGEEPTRQVERMLLLQFTDQHWKNHLLAMDRLRDGIGLRGYGQRNPLLEYKREGTSMFLMMSSLRDEAVVSQLFTLTLEEDAQVPEVSKQAAKKLVVKGGLPKPEAVASGMQIGGPQTPPPKAPPPPKRPAKGIEARDFAVAQGTKRNQPCPCGSGQKFKKCCYLVEDVAPAP